MALSALPLGYAATPALAYGAAPALAYNAAPVAAAPAIPAPLAAPSSQFHAQDELGNVNYGYSNINSAKQEVGNAYGGVTGSYSYVDANGIPQRVDYIADGLGFRVRATNLPVAPATPAVAELQPVVYTGVAPEPVQDTPEVAEAKAKFQAAFEEAKNRNKRSAQLLAYNNLALPYAYNSGLYGYSNLAYSGYATAPLAAAYAAPAATYAAPAAAVVSAPAAREAVLTTIKLNPGHAVAYRVD